MSILLQLQKILKDKKKIFINNDNNSVDNCTHFMEQAFNKPYPNMKSKCTSTKEIELIIKSLKTKNSYEYDKIFTRILRLSGTFIGSPINYICNKMLFWGIFSDRLKYAIINHYIKMMIDVMYLNIDLILKNI